MSDHDFYDLNEIKEKLAGRIDEFVTTLYPEAKKETSCYKVGGIDGEKGTSMMISTRANNAGYFIDYANPDIRGKAWRLASLRKGISFKEGIVWVANFLNIPPVQSFGSVSQSKDPAALARTIRPLSPASIAYAESRKISEETLRKYGVGSSISGGCLFPYYDALGQLGMTKHWGHKLKDGKKETWTSSEPVMSLFGKDVCDPENNHEQLIITEGEWDAMALCELGMPAVSIPMGVSNLKWIEEDYHFLSHFDDIVLIFDNDEPGKKGAKEVIGRLGSDRCMSVVLPLKDANDMLKKGRGSEIKKIIESTSREPIAEIADPDDMRETAKAYMRGDHLTEGDGFFMPSYDLTFRTHEITLWFGFSGHGKSQAVQNQTASLIAQGELCCVASFEQPAEMTFSQILLNYSAYPNLPYTEEFNAAYDFLASRCFMYKSRKRTDPRHLIQTFIHAHKRYGVKHFVIDNVMTMDIDRGDNTAQAAAADLVRVFAAEYPVHVHIVAHPRKPPENTKTPPGMAEIRGASEWGDIPNNVVTVWRNMDKAERLAEMEDDDNITDREMLEFAKSTPCGRVITRKQRATGALPMTSFYFHKETKRFVPKWGDPKPLYSDKPWKE